MNSLSRLARQSAAHTRRARAALQVHGAQGQRWLSVHPYRAKELDPEAMMKTLPPKPEPPEDSDCCLSGCEFCVWDLYDDDMREYQEQAQAIRQAFEASGLAVPEQLKPERLRDSIDPTMRAFLDMERDLAIKAQEEKDKETIEHKNEEED